ncbi:MAG: DegT/DnrJ/EryC1/StrS family aminotransferase, partial [Bacteroidales bacterium]
QYTLRITNGKRDALKEHLSENDIPCAVYYPLPLHAQKAFEGFSHKPEDFPVTNRLVQEVISLPMHTELQPEQQEHIVNAILCFMNNV